MAKVDVVEDLVLKDSNGNGKFVMKIDKRSLLGGITKYNFTTLRKEQEGLTICNFTKLTSGGVKKYIFELYFDEREPRNNAIVYIVNDGITETKYDVLGNDVRFNAKTRAEENALLEEFDKLMWTDANTSQSKSTLVDVITDVIDTTRRDDTVIGEEVIKDANLIHMAAKGFFAEINPNVDAINFEE